MCALQVDTIRRERRGPDVPVRIRERAGLSRVPMCSKKLLTANAHRIHVSLGRNPEPAPPLGSTKIKNFKVHGRPEGQSIFQFDRPVVVKSPEVSLPEVPS